MKRIVSIVSIILAILMLSALFVGCGSSGPEGMYVVKSIDGKPVEEAIKSTAESAGVSEEELLKQMNVDSVEEIVTLELKADGTAKMNVKMFSTEMEGTWKQDGDNIAITMEDTTANFTLKGNELTSQEGDQQYTFIKK